MLRRPTARRGHGAPTALTSGDLTLGSLTVRFGPGRRFSERDKAALAELADHGGRAVHAVQLADELLASRHLLVTAREEERSRIRRDLHDELGPTLASLAMQLAGLEQLIRSDPLTAAHGYRASSSRPAGRSRTCAGSRVPCDRRHWTNSVSPVPFDRPPRRSGCTSDDEIDLPPLAPAVEVAAFRIGAEALTNVARHAGDRRVSLTLASQDGELVLTVVDHGRGTGRAPAGVGILAMRERAEELGGTLIIRDHGGRRYDRAGPATGDRPGEGRAMSIRVVIADDHPMFREGLRFVLDQTDDITVVGEAGDGAAALQVVHGLDPDVVLMDLAMPVLDGLAATSRLAAAGARAAVLVLTMTEADAGVFAAIRAGARGYLVKGVAPEQVVSAVRALAAGNAVFGPDIANRMLRFFADRPAEDPRSVSPNCPRASARCWPIWRRACPIRRSPRPW